MSAPAANDAAVASPCTFAGCPARRRIVAVNTPNYPLVIGGYTLPGYAAIYSVILNLAVAVVLTPVFRALRGGKPPVDATVAADYVG